MSCHNGNSFDLRDSLKRSWRRPRSGKPQFENPRRQIILTSFPFYVINNVNFLWCIFCSRSLRSSFEDHCLKVTTDPKSSRTQNEKPRELQGPRSEGWELKMPSWIHRRKPSLQLRSNQPPPCQGGARSGGWRPGSPRAQGRRFRICESQENLPGGARRR